MVGGSALKSAKALAKGLVAVLRKKSGESRAQALVFIKVRSLAGGSVELWEAVKVAESAKETEWA